MHGTCPRHFILALALLAAACSHPTAETTKPPENADAAAPSEDGVVVLFLGDSLSAGYGLPSQLSFPALVETALQDEGLGVRVINAGVSGDTTAGGLSRLSWVLGASQPDVLVVQLGANDGLRGFPVEEIESNLHAIVEGARAAGARVLAGAVSARRHGSRGRPLPHGGAAASLERGWRPRTQDQHAHGASDPAEGRAQPRVPRRGSCGAPRLRAQLSHPAAGMTRAKAPNAFAFCRAPDCRAFGRAPDCRLVPRWSCTPRTATGRSFCRKRMRRRGRAWPRSHAYSDCNGA